MAFYGKVVIITGASSGIGAATALNFAKEAATLVLTARSLPNLEKTRDNCLSLGVKNLPTPLIITADLTKEADIEEIVKQTTSKFGKIDILVNNAGANKYHTIENVTMEAFDFVIRTNLRSVYYLTTLSIPYLAKTEGCIVNVSSITCYRPNANTYCASKGALDQFTRVSAVELGPKKIRINTVSPGLVNGTFQKKCGMADDQYEKMLNDAKSSYPLGRPAEPEDIANAICFLASEKAKYITGVILPVDGGKSCV
ncbi:3-oxoacyl-[acyl-carrier-protein] reductase FabG-like [Culicoides brevitarsis]|uniref:3-oxoacyl-[acyl-carrier-protein] reductase FabG-like n=1 Tax=Culicoides brevitarsis TaxID=469753 RepID=UPI00307B994A